MKPGALLRLCAFLGYALLLAPGAVVLVLSFSAGEYLTFPPPGFSLRWYGALLAHEEIMTGLRNSAILAALVAAVSLLVAAPAAYAVARLDFPGRDTLAILLAAPLLMPSLVVGLALLLALQPIGLTATFPGLVLGHCVLTVPFAIRIMATGLATVPRSLEAAAASLGASPLTTALRVTLPLAAPAAGAAAALAFLVSFDETVISLFLVGPRLPTLPIAMFRYAEHRADPLIAALSVALIVFAALMVVLIERLMGLTRAMGRA